MEFFFRFFPGGPEKFVPVSAVPFILSVARRMTHFLENCE